MGYLDRLKKHVSAECPPDPLPLLPKALLAPLAVATGHVSRKQGRAIVGPDTTAAPFDQEWYEERAAIYEFDAGMSRQEAERRAYLEVTKWMH
jgi:hypothetical protein